MSSRRPYRLALAALAATALAACSPDTPAPSAPELRGSLDVSSGPVVVKSLLRNTPLASDVYASAVIGPDGGVIQVQDAGLRVKFPAGVLRAPTTITVRAIAGSEVAYEFGPSMVFSAPVELRQDLKATNSYKLPAGSVLQGAYFADPGQLSQSTGTATVNELLPTLVDLKNASVTFNVWHFSGYMVSSGRGGEDSQ